MLQVKVGSMIHRSFRAPTLVQHLAPFLVAIAFMTMGSLGPTPSHAAAIYWTDSSAGTIQRANLDGTGAHVIVSDLAYPEGIVVDAANERLYWTEGAAGAIRKSQLDGSGAETLISGIGTPADLAVDLQHQRIYWTDVAVGNIWRANLDGTGAELLFSVAGHSRGIAVDPDAGKIYVTGGLNSKVQRANLDGSNLEDLLTGLSNPIEITLDPVMNSFYVTDVSGLIRADLDGSNPMLVVDPMGLPSGIAIDTFSGKLYWTEFASPFVSRANLDGSENEVLIDSGPEVPRHIAIDLTGVAGVDSDPLVLDLPSMRHYPEPFSSYVDMRIASGGTTPITVSIHDVTGRSVRTLQHRGAGRADETVMIRWDGRDDRGAEVPNGVYWVQARAKGLRLTGKVVRF